MALLLHMQNVSPMANGTDIERFFIQYTIKANGINIIGGPNGDAFVTFVHEQDLLKALELSNNSLLGKWVQLSIITPEDMNALIKIRSPEYSSNPPWHGKENRKHKNDQLDRDNYQIGSCENRIDDVHNEARTQGFHAGGDSGVDAESTNILRNRPNFPRPDNFIEAERDGPIYNNRGEIFSQNEPDQRKGWETQGKDSQFSHSGEKKSTYLPHDMGGPNLDLDGRNYRGKFSDTSRFSTTSRYQNQDNVDDRDYSMQTKWGREKSNKAMQLTDKDNDFRTHNSDKYIKEHQRSQSTSDHRDSEQRKRNKPLDRYDQQSMDPWTKGDNKGFNDSSYRTANEPQECQSTIARNDGSHKGEGIASSDIDLRSEPSNVQDELQQSGSVYRKGESRRDKRGHEEQYGDASSNSSRHEVVSRRSDYDDHGNKKMRMSDNSVPQRGTVQSYSNPHGEIQKRHERIFLELIKICGPNSPCEQSLLFLGIFNLKPDATACSISKEFDGRDAILVCKGNQVVSAFVAFGDSKTLDATLLECPDAKSFTAKVVGEILVELLECTFFEARRNGFDHFVTKKEQDELKQVMIESDLQQHEVDKKVRVVSQHLEGSLFQNLTANCNDSSLCFLSVYKLGRKDKMPCSVWRLFKQYSNGVILEFKDNEPSVAFIGFEDQYRRNEALQNSKDLHPLSARETAMQISQNWLDHSYFYYESRIEGEDTRVNLEEQQLLRVKLIGFDAVQREMYLSKQEKFERNPYRNIEEKIRIENSSAQAFIKKEERIQRAAAYQEVQKPFVVNQSNPIQNRESMQSNPESYRIHEGIQTIPNAYQQNALQKSGANRDIMISNIKQTDKETNSTFLKLTESYKATNNSLHLLYMDDIWNPTLNIWQLFGGRQGHNEGVLVVMKNDQPTFAYVAFKTQRGASNETRKVQGSKVHSIGEACWSLTQDWVIGDKYQIHETKSNGEQSIVTKAAQQKLSELVIAHEKLHSTKLFYMLYLHSEVDDEEPDALCFLRFIYFERFRNANQILEEFKEFSFGVILEVYGSYERTPTVGYIAYKSVSVRRQALQRNLIYKELEPLSAQKTARLIAAHYNDKDYSYTECLDIKSSRTVSQLDRYRLGYKIGNLEKTLISEEAKGTSVVLLNQEKRKREEVMARRGVQNRGMANEKGKTVKDVALEKHSAKRSFKTTAFEEGKANDRHGKNENKQYDAIQQKPDHGLESDCDMPIPRLLYKVKPTVQYIRVEKKHLSPNITTLEVWAKYRYQNPLNAYSRDDDPQTVTLIRDAEGIAQFAFVSKGVGDGKWHHQVSHAQRNSILALLDPNYSIAELSASGYDRFISDSERVDFIWKNAG